MDDIRKFDELGNELNAEEQSSFEVAQAQIETPEDNQVPTFPESVTPDENNTVVLPGETSLENIKIDGDNLVLIQSDGSEIVIVGAAVNIPTFIIGEIEIPQSTMVLALNSSGINVAAGPGSTFVAVVAVPLGSGDQFSNPFGQSLSDLLSDGENGLPNLSDLLGNTDLLSASGDEDNLEVPAVNFVPTAFDVVAETVLDDEPVGIQRGNAGGNKDVPDITSITNSGGILFVTTDLFGSVEVDTALLEAQNIQAIWNSDGKGTPAAENLIYTAVQGGANALIFTATGEDSGDVVFILTIDGDGSYRLETFKPLVHRETGAAEDNFEFVFTFTIFDVDGDSATGTLTVAVNDDAPVVDSTQNAGVDLDDDTLVAAGVPGTLDMSVGADGGTVRWLDGDDATNASKSTGGAANISYAVGDDGTLTVSQTQNGADVDIFTVTLNANSGAFTVTHLNNLLHADGDGENDEVFTLGYRVTDGDDDVENGQITVTLNDDVPVIGKPEASSVDEDNIANGNVDSGYDGDLVGSAATSAGSLDIDWGADDEDNDASSGASGDRTVVFDATQDGLAGLKSGGEAVSIEILADGTLVGHTGDSAPTGTGDASVVFFASLNDNDAGSYAFTLVRPLDHDAANTEDDIDLVFAFTADDGDRDSASATFTVTVDDDAPVVDSTQNAGVDLDDDTLVAAGVPGTLDMSVGADGGTVRWLDGDDATNASKSTGGAANISYAVGDDGTLTVSQTQNGADVDIFTVTLNANSGAFTVTHLNNLLHADGDGENDEVFTLGYRVTDGDDDVENGQITVTLNDDVPVIGKPEASSVDEDNIANGNVDSGYDGDLVGSAATSAGSLDIDWGADDEDNDASSGASGDRTVVFDATQDGLAGLKSGGEAVSIEILADGTLVGHTGDSAPTGTGDASVVFFASLNDNDAGSYAFTLVRPLDHDAANTEDDIDLVFAFTADDGDRDSASATFTVTVDDDAPVVDSTQNAGVDLDDDTLVAAGVPGTLDMSVGADGGTVRWLDGDDATNASKSTGGAANISYAVGDDGTLTVSQTQNGADVDIFTVTLNANSGAFTVTHLNNLLHADGDGENDEVFTLGYRVTDGDDDVENGQITVTLNDDVPVIGKPEASSVDEDNIANGNVDSGYDGDLVGSAATSAGSLDIDWGADDEDNDASSGASGDRTVVFDATQDGLAGLKSGGEAVSIEILADGTLVGHTGDSAPTGTGDASVVFFASLNDNDAGSYAFTLVRPLDHDAANTEDDIDLVFAFTADDGDRDSASATFTVTVDDDAPVVDSTQNAGVDLDDDTLVAAGVPGTLDMSVGADGGTVRWLDGDDATNASKSTGGAANISYAVGDDGTLTVSQTQNGADVDIFTVTLNANSGAFTVTHLNNLLHADGDGENDEVFTLGYRVTDGDDDVENGQITVTLNDDVPVIGKPEASSVDEDNIANGNVDSGYDGDLVGSAATSAGSLDIDWGADDEDNDASSGASGDRTVVFDATQDGLAGLKSGGEAVSIEILADGTLVGHTGDSAPTGTGDASVVFFASLNDNDAGSYAFTLVRPLDHDAANTEDDIDLVFAFTADDGDRDSASATFTVTVDDDAPVVDSTQNAGVDLDDDTLVAAGVPGTLDMSVGADGGTVRWLDGDDATNASKSTGGAANISYAVGDDGTLTVSQTQNGADVDIFTVTLNANSGAFTVTHLNNLLHADGDGENDEVFTLGYRVTDGDDDVENGQITVTLNDDVPVVVSANNNAVQLDDDALSLPAAAGNGIPDGVGDVSPDTANLNGILDHAMGSDGGNVAWHQANMSTSGGAQGISFEVAPNGTLVTVFQNQNSVKTQIFTATLAPETGAYEVIQTANLLHANGLDENNQNFTLGYLVVDDDKDEATGTLTISLNDDSPVAANDTATLDEDTSITIPASANDELGADGNHPVNTFAIVASTNNGQLVNNGDGTFSYTPSADFNGADSFTYSITDGDGDVSTATVNITINPVNDAPTMQAGTGDAIEDGDAIDINLAQLGDDVDADDDPFSLEYTITGLPSEGSATIDGTTLTFDPENDFQNLAFDEERVVTLEVTATDKHEATASNNIEVTVTGINDDPTMASDTGETDEDGAAITFDLKLLGNDIDSDDDGSSLTYAVTGQPSEGLVSIDANKVLTFDPGLDFQDLALDETKDVTIEVTATDKHGATATNTITVTVTGINDAPIFPRNDFEEKTQLYTSGQHGAWHPFFATAGVWAEANSAGGTDIQEIEFTRFVELEAGTYTLDLAADNYASLKLNGRLLIDLPNLLGENFNQLNSATINLPEGLHELTVAARNHEAVGAGGVAVQIRDADGNVVWTPHNALTPISNVEAFEVVEDGSSINIDLKTLADDADSDDNGSTLSYEITRQPGEGSASIDSDKVLSFDPGDNFQDLAEGETRDVTVQITAEDSHQAKAVRDITITVTGVNDDPNAVADDNSQDAVIEEGYATVGDDTAEGNVLSNDTDVDTTDTHTVTGVIAGMGSPIGNVGQSIEGVYGSITINENGSYTYRLNNADADTEALSEGQQVTDVFTYEVSDNNGGTDTAKVTINITGSDDNRPPVAVDDVLTGDEIITSATLHNGSEIINGISNTAAEGTAIDSATGKLFSKATYFHDSSLAVFDSLDDFLAGNSASGTLALQTTFLPGTYFAVVDGAIIGREGNLGADNRTWPTSTSIAKWDAMTGEKLAVSDPIPGIGGQNVSHTFNWGGFSAPAIIHDQTGVYVTGTLNGTTWQVVKINSEDLSVEQSESVVLGFRPGWAFTVDGVVFFGQSSGSDIAIRAFDFATGNLTNVTIDLGLSEFGTGIYIGDTTYDIANDRLYVSSRSGGELVIDDISTKLFVSSSSTNEDTVLTIDDADLLANDSDPDGDDLTITEVSDSANGVEVVLNNDGTITYDPTALNIFQSLAEGQTLEDTFTYTITDGNGEFDTATVTLTVAGVNDAANISGQSTGEVTEDTNVSDGNLSVTGTLNVTDVDTGESSFNPNAVAFARGNHGEQTARGTLTINADGEWEYTIDNSLDAVQALGVGDSFTETFTVQSVDGTEYEVTATVNGVNDVPLAEDDELVAGASLAGLSISDIDSNLEQTNTIGSTSNGNNLPITNIASLLNNPYSFGYDNGFTSSAIGDGGHDMYDGGNRLSADGNSFNYTNGQIVSSSTFGQGSSYASYNFSGAFVLVAKDISINTFEISGNLGADGRGSVRGGSVSFEIAGTQYTTFYKTVFEASYDPTVSQLIIVEGDGSGITNNFPTNSDNNLQTVSGLNGVGDLFYVLVAERDNASPGQTGHLTEEEIIATSKQFVLNAFGVTEESALGTSGNGDSVTDEDTALTFDGDNLLANDTDIDGDPLTITQVSDSANGATVTLNNDGTITFDPTSANAIQSLAEGETLEDTFTYTITDGNGEFDTATVKLTVEGVNDRPVANEDHATTDEDVPITIDVLNNDNDLDTNDTLSITGNPTARNGMVEIVNGQLVYTPNENFNGTDTIMYYVTDGHDNPPVTEQNPIGGGQLDGNGVYFVYDLDTGQVGSGRRGTFNDQTVAENLGVTNGLTFLIEENGSGNGLGFSFEVYRVIDGTSSNFNGHQANIVSGNGDAFTLNQAANNFSPIDAGELTIDIVDAGITHQFKVNNLTYNTTNEVTFDSVTVTPQPVSATVEVTVIPINDAPNAVNDEFAGGGGVGQINLENGLVAHYEFEDNFEDSTTNEWDGGPDSLNQGVSVGFVDGQIGRALDINLNSYVKVSHQSQQQGGHDLPDGAEARSVSFWVNPENLSQSGNMISWGENATGERFSILQYQDDIYFIGQFVDIKFDSNLVDDWQHITLTFEAGSMKLYVNGAEDPVVFDATSGNGVVNTGQGGLYFGRNVDGRADEAWAGQLDDVRVYDRILSQAEISELAGSQPLDVINEDTIFTLEIDRLLENDNDLDGDQISITEVTNSANGAVVTLDVDNGNITYDPTNVASIQSLAEGDTFEDTFTYTISDGNGGFDTATVTLTVGGINDIALITGDTSGDVTEDTDVDGSDNIVASGKLNVVDVDTDESAFDPNSVVFDSASHGDGSERGSLTIDVDGNWEYTINNDLESVQSLRPGESFTETFTVASFDGTQQTITATVNGANDAPTAVDDIFTGSVDAIVPDFSRSGASFLFNDSLGNFAHINQTNSTQGVSGVAVALGDIDGDGDLDPIFGNHYAPVYYYNNVAGTINYHGGRLLDGVSWDIDFGDLDGDGDLDVIAPGREFSVIPIYVNDSQSNSLGYANNFLPDAFRVQTVELGDLDGDGDLDAVAGGTGGFSIYRNDGNLNFVRIQDAGVGDTFQIKLGDVDNDGDLDAVGVTRSSALNNFVWLNDGLGNFSETQETLRDVNVGYDHTGIALGDVDNDGDIDAVTISFESAGGTAADAVWLNDGTGSFTATQTTEFGIVAGQYHGATVGIALSDVDYDGDLDGLVTTWGGADVLLINDGTGQFTGETVVPRATQGEQPTFGDLDHDGFSEDAVKHFRVLDNDSDPDGDTINIVGVGVDEDTQSVTGLSVNGATISISDDGKTVIYDPTSSAALQGLVDGEQVDDTFTYTISDGNGGFDTATVTVNVDGRDDAAAISGDTTDGVTEDTDVDASDNLVASGKLTVVDPDADQAAFDPTSIVFDSASHGEGSARGSLTIDADGNWEYTISNDLAAVQGLGDNENFTETFMVQSVDGTQQAITATVNGINDVPVAGDANETTTESVSFSGNLATLVTDVDHDVPQEISFAIESLVLKSSPFLEEFLQQVGSIANILLPENASREIEYLGRLENGDALIAMVNPDVTNAQLERTVTGQSLAFFTGGTAKIINVGPVTSDPATSFTADYTPVGAPGGNIVELVDSEVSFSDYSGVLDSVELAVDQDTGVASLNGTTVGIVTIDQSTGAFSFDPAGDFEGLAFGENAELQVNYSATDGDGATDTGSITLTVEGENDAPVAVDDELSTEIGEILVNQETNNGQSHASIATLPNGNIVIAWGTEDGVDDQSGWGIKARIFQPDGTPVADEFLVNQLTAGDQYNSNITSFPNGQFAVIWQNGIGDNEGVKASIFNADGSRAVDEFLVNLDANGLQGQPNAVALANNTLAVTWHTDDGQQDTDLFGIKSRIIKFSGAQVDQQASSAEALVNDTTVESQVHPSVVLLSNGNFVVTWTTYHSTSGISVRARIYDDANNPVTGQLLLSEFPSGDQLYSEVAALNGGGFVSVWQSEDGAQDASGFGVKARFFDNNGVGTGSEFLVNSSTPGDQTRPDVAVLSNGNVVFTWVSSVDAQDNSVSAIKARVFDANGIEVVSEFLVNQEIAGEQYYPYVTELENGKFAVSWHSADGVDDNSGFGIKMRIFNADGTPATGLSFAEDSLSLINNFDLLANDTDIDGDVLSITSVSGTSANGAAVTLNNDGTISYDPRAVNAIQQLGNTETLEDTFTYTISDGNGGSDTATVTLTVQGINDAPTAVDDTATVDEDGSVTIDVLSNDTDVEGDQISLTGTPTAQNGTVQILNGELVYTPNANFFGPDTINYEITDGGGSDTGYVDVTVNSIPDAPDGTDNTIKTNEDTAYTFSEADFGFNDGDDNPTPDDFVGVVISTLPHQGQLLLNGNAITAGDVVNINDINAGNLTFEPAADGNGDPYSSFTFQVLDDGAVSGGNNQFSEQTTPFGWTGGGPQTWIWGTAIQGPTHSTNQTAFFKGQGYLSGVTFVETVASEQPNAIAVSGKSYRVSLDYLNNRGSEAADITVVVKAGDLEIGRLNYSHASEFPGYQRDVPSEANVSLDTIEVPQSLNGEPISVHISENAGHGPEFAVDNVVLTEVGGDGTNMLVNGDFGSGNFYTGENADPIPNTMTIDVDPVNDDPVAVDDALMTYGGGLSIIDVLANDTDIDNGGPEVQLAFAVPQASSKVVSVDASGNTALVDSFSVSGLEYDVLFEDFDRDGDNDLIFINVDVGGAHKFFENDGSDNFTQTLTFGSTNSDRGVAADFNGDGLLDVGVSDRQGNVSVYLNQSAPGNPNFGPAISLGQGSFLTTGIDAGDVDGDGDVDIVNPGGNFQIDGGLQVWLNDGAANFTQSAQGNFGQNSFGTQNVSEALLVDIDNDGDLDIAAAQNTSTAGQGSFETWFNDGFGNFSLGQKTQIANGSEPYQLVAGDVTGDGHVEIYQSQRAGSSRPDLLWTNDGNGGFVATSSGSSAESIGAVGFDANGDGLLDVALGNFFESDQVLLSNGSGGFEAPDAVAGGSAWTNGVDSAIKYDLNVTAYDSTSAKGATVRWLGGGKFSYTAGNLFSSLKMGETDTDTFTYTISDGNGVTDTATVNITIQGVNDTPIALDDQFSGNEDAVITGNVLDDNGNGVDSDLDGDVLNVTPIFDKVTANGGIVNLLASGAFTYTPASNYSGTDSFEYIVDDGNGGLSTGTVNLTITPVADGPLVNFSSTPVTNGDELLVNSTTAGSQFYPRSSGLKDGGFVFVWEQDDGAQKDIIGKLYNSDGNNVIGEFTINTHTSGDQVRPVVATLADGGFVVAWSSYPQDGNNWGVFAQRFDKDGAAVGSEFAVNSTTHDFQAWPSIADLENGGFVITWEGRNQAGGEDRDVFGQVYDANGNALGNEFRVNSTFSGSQYNSDVAGLSDGGFVATWHSEFQDGSSWGVIGQRFDNDGATVGNEFIVNTTTNGFQAWPYVSSLNDGHFVVVWEADSQDGNPGLGIFGQVFDENGLKIGGEFQVNTYSPNTQARVAATALPDGGFVVTWDSNLQDGDFGNGSGNEWGIIAQRFDAAGTKIGEEFVVNTYKNGNQSSPEITGLADGGILISWHSFAQDGDNWGAYAQRYHVPGLAYEGQQIQIPLTVALVDDDGSEILSTLALKGLPTSFVVTDGNHSLTSDGVNSEIDIINWDLANLKIVPAADFVGDLEISVTAETTEEGNGDKADATDVITVNVLPVVGASQPAGLTEPITFNDDNQDDADKFILTFLHKAEKFGIEGLSTGSEFDSTLETADGSEFGLVSFVSQDFIGGAGRIFSVIGFRDGQEVARHDFTSDPDPAKVSEVILDQSDFGSVDKIKLQTVGTIGFFSNFVFQFSAPNAEPSLEEQIQSAIDAIEADADTVVVNGSGGRTNGGDGNPADPNSAYHQQNKINGTDGHDDIYAYGGNDLILTKNGSDQANGGEGDDIVVGGTGVDNLRGGPGADILMGEEGDDILFGNDGIVLASDPTDGDDILIGGAGVDTKTGAGGADRFVIDPTAFNEANMADIITDYSFSEGDQIDLGELLASALGTAADETAAQGNVRLENNGTDTEVIVENGTVDDVTVASLNGVHTQVRILYNGDEETNITT